MVLQDGLGFRSYGEDLGRRVCGFKSRDRY